MTMYQQGFPVNAAGEIVVSGGSGDSSVVATLAPDMVPIDSAGNGIKFGNVAQIVADATGLYKTIPAIGTEYVLKSNPTASEFQQLHNLLVSLGEKCTIKFQYADQCSWTQAVTIDAAYVGVHFNWSTINTSAMGAGIPITVTGSVTPPYGQTQTVLQYLTLIGSGRAGTMTAMLFAGPNTGGNGPSRIRVQGITLKDFNTGIKFGPNSYCQNFEDIEIYQVGTGIYFPDGQGDSGERPVFRSSVIFQCDTAVRVDGNHGVWLHFEGCSFDHNGRQFDVRGSAKVWATDCHIEASDYAIAPIILTGDGTVFKMQGGQFVVTNTTSRTMPYIVDNSVTGGGGAYFNDVNLWKAYTLNKYFATGTGRTYVNGYTTISTHDQPILLNSNFNALKDGGFENSIEDDLICIHKDTAAITSAITGTNLTLSYSATSPRTGSKCLKVTKVGAAATNAGFYIAIPIRNNKQRGSYRGYFKTIATGTFTVNPAYVRLQVDGSGVHLNKGTSVSESQQTKSDTSGSWVVASSSLQNISTPPEWATHYALFIDLTSKGAGDVYFDDFELALM